MVTNVVRTCKQTVLVARLHHASLTPTKLSPYYFPWQLEAALRDFVAYYNNERYHVPRFEFLLQQLLLSSQCTQLIAVSGHLTRSGR